jgi:hypothetical protein
MTDTAEKPVEGASAEMLGKRAVFESAYRDWHAATAVFYDPEQSDDSRLWTARDEKREATSMALLMTPAPYPWCVWMK